MARTAMILVLPFALLLSVSRAPAEEEARREPTFTVSEVTIERPFGPAEDGASFPVAGSLRVPTKPRPKPGHPAVLFISGSGSQTRDGVQGGLDLGTREVLDAVADAGFVVLATDDRGVGKTPIGPEGRSTRRDRLRRVGGGCAGMPWPGSSSTRRRIRSASSSSATARAG